jgi:precorrin isomerase
MPHTYITDGAEIYRQSFATIRSEAMLSRFTPEEEIVAVRMIHAAGMVGLEEFAQFSEGMEIRGRPLRWNFGALTLQVHWSQSEMRPQHCFTC